MIILDTNVISALMQSTPEIKVIDWLNEQPPESIWTTSVTVFEIMFGLHCMPKGKRQQGLIKAFKQALQKDLEGRILNFDVAAAKKSAIISANLRAPGRPIEIRDVQIAGIVSARYGILATRNVKHFINSKISLINPWEVE